MISLLQGLRERSPLQAVENARCTQNLGPQASRTSFGCAKVARRATFELPGFCQCALCSPNPGLRPEASQEAALHQLRVASIFEKVMDVSAIITLLHLPGGWFPSTLGQHPPEGNLLLNNPPGPRARGPPLRTWARGPPGQVLAARRLREGQLCR